MAATTATDGLRWQRWERFWMPGWWRWRPLTGGRRPTGAGPASRAASMIDEYPILSVAAAFCPTAAGLRIALLRRSMLRSSLYIPGTVHQSHSDTPTWVPGPLARRLAMRGSERLHVAHAAIARIADAHVRAAAVGEPPELDKLWHTRAAPADPFCYLPGLEPERSACGAAGEAPRH